MENQSSLNNSPRSGPQSEHLSPLGRSKSFKVFDFNNPDNVKQRDEDAHKQHLLKQAHFKDNTSGAKLKHHSLYGETIHKNEDIKDEMYDSKYRTFIKERDSDEEQSQNSETRLRKQSTKKIPFQHQITELFNDDEDEDKYFARLQQRSGLNAENSSEEEEEKVRPDVKPIDDWHGPTNKKANNQQKVKNFAIEQWAAEDPDDSN